MSADNIAHSEKDWRDKHIPIVLSLDQSNENGAEVSLTLLPQYSLKDVDGMSFHQPSLLVDRDGAYFEFSANS